MEVDLVDADRSFGREGRTVILMFYLMIGFGAWLHIVDDDHEWWIQFMVALLWPALVTATLLECADKYLEEEV